MDRQPRQGAPEGHPPRSRIDSNGREWQVADRLHSAAIHLLRDVRKVDVATGLSAARLSALSVVVYTGPLSMGQLAAAEQVRPPTMTRLVAGLEEDGLVRRRPDPTDRRAVLIRATPKGSRVLQRGRHRRIEVLVERLRTLAGPELRRLERALDALERIARSG